VYLRISERFLPRTSRAETFLDIANIEVKEPRRYLTNAWAIHELYEAAAHLQIRVYVENVIEPRIAHYLYNNPLYVFVPNQADPEALTPCFVTRSIK
jgi:ribosome-associated toxin RatA of RatAB toxin-antitoxin module